MSKRETQFTTQFPVIKGDKIMKKTVSIILSLMMLISLTSGVSTNASASQKGSVDVEVSVTENYDYANQVLNIVNEERAKVGASSLTMDATLYAAAMTRAAETVVNFDHIRPDGTTCFSIASSKMQGENIHAGTSTPEAAMKSWMNSQGHKENLLNTRWKSIGVGCVKYGSTYFWVQCFGSGTAQSVSKSGTAGKTAKITVCDDLFELYYNSVNSISASSTTGRTPVIVGLNKGWSGHCYTIANSKFNFTSSDTSIFTVATDGTITPVGNGSANITAKLKADSTVYISKQITVSGVKTPEQTHTHDYSNLVEDVAPTCSTDGYKVYKCTGCTSTKKVTVNATGKHDYTSVTQRNSCEENSVTVYTCKDCGYSYKKTNNDAGEHSLATQNKAATCTQNGYKRSYCTKCDYFRTTIIPAKGHSYIKLYSVPDTNAAAGYDVYQCKTCGKTLNKEHKFVPATKITTLKKGKQSFTVNWTVVKGAGGYQVQYATDSKFTSGKKTVTVTGAKTTKKTVKNLKSGKKYYVRVREYKVMDGKKIYSKWTKAKTVKAK